MSELFRNVLGLDSLEMSSKIVSRAPGPFTQGVRLRAGIENGNIRFNARDQGES
jgi:hypothetical protein